MTVIKFDKHNVSDQKRLVRGEHWLLCRTRLRIRDNVHHRAWRILMLAGGYPAGEINAIRELMPKAHITAVDMDAECLGRAIDAGADEVIQCDLSKWTFDGIKRLPAHPLSAVPAFDAVNLDFCGGANGAMRDMAAVYRRLLTKAGVYMLTFSYGRDLIEIFKHALDNTPEHNRKRLKAVAAACGNELVSARIHYLFPPGRLKYLKSVIVYRGSEMPMCSLLFQANAEGEPVSVVKIGDGDFEIASCYPDSASLYDCPRDRIEQLRRSHAAIKASYTRGRKRAVVCQHNLLIAEMAAAT